MTADDEPHFLPMTDEDGNVIGCMDQQAADFLTSTLPDPTQASLDDAWAGVTRVRLLGARTGAGYMVCDIQRLEITDADSLTELRESLAIAEADEYAHCLSPEDHVLELSADGELVTELELLDWTMIRRSEVWRGDANLADPGRFAQWLLHHGIPEAWAAHEEHLRWKVEYDRDAERWVQAMPASLHVLWPQKLDYTRSPDLDSARVLLVADYPRTVDRIAALYSWLAAGRAEWGSYRGFEKTAMDLLEDHPRHTLVAAIGHCTTDASLIGAARLLAREIADFDATQCSPPLRDRMRQAVERQGIPTNIAAFARVFGD